MGERGLAISGGQLTAYHLRVSSWALFASPCRPLLSGNRRVREGRDAVDLGSSSRDGHNDN